MKNLLVAATAAMVLSAGVTAQEQTGGEGMIGGVKTTTVAAGVVGVAVAAAIISNNRGSSVSVIDPIDPVDPDPTCNPGDGAPVNGICTGTTVTVTVSGTGTASVPVTFTYPAING